MSRRADTLLRLRDLQRRVADRALAVEQNQLAIRQDAAAQVAAASQDEWRAAHVNRLPCDAWAVLHREQLNAAARLCQEAAERVDRARAETVARRQDHDSAQRIWEAARRVRHATEARREHGRLLELAVARSHVHAGNGRG